MAVLLDQRGRIGRVVDQDLLGGQHDPHRVLVRLDVELAVVLDELHQVEARQVAGGVIQIHVFTAVVNYKTVCNEVVCNGFSQVEDWLVAQRSDGGECIDELVAVGSDRPVETIERLRLLALGRKPDLLLEPQARRPRDAERMRLLDRVLLHATLAVGHQRGEPAIAAVFVDPAHDAEAEQHALDLDEQLERGRVERHVLALVATVLNRAVGGEEATEQGRNARLVQPEGVIGEALEAGSFVQNGVADELLDDWSRAERQPRAGRGERHVDIVVPAH